jgi:hypothetical protein
VGCHAKKPLRLGRGWDNERDTDLWWIYLAARRIVALSERYFDSAFSSHAQYPAAAAE